MHVLSRNPRQVPCICMSTGPKQERCSVRRNCLLMLLNVVLLRVLSIPMIRSFCSGNHTSQSRAASLAKLWTESALGAKIGSYLPLQAEPGSVLDFVDLLIGTGGHGHVFPGAIRPQAMIIASPWTHSFDRWDSQAGFDSDSGQQLFNFYGMAHSALSGAGSGELGQIRLLPLEGAGHDMQLDRNIQAKPGYFRGRAKCRSFSGAGIEIESTTTERAAVHRFTFSSEQHPTIRLELKPAPDTFWGYEVVDSKIIATSNQSVEGCEASKNNGLGGVTLTCFALHFSMPYKDVGPHRGRERGRTSMLLQFPDATAGDTIEARIAISHVSVEHAKASLEREVPSRLSFDQVRRDSAKAWEDVLGLVDANFTTAAQKRMFYTAFYHMNLFPSLTSEEDGSFRLQAGGSAQLSLDKVDQILPVLRVAAGTTFFTTFSFWDTYRSLHPLLNMLRPQLSMDFGASILRMVREWGHLPPWQLQAGPSDMMEGDGGSIVLCSMALAGIINKMDALGAVVKSRKFPSSVHNALENLTAGRPNGTDGVSKLIEEARADACAARLAEAVGQRDIAKHFRRRAESVRYYWDKERHVFAPRSGNTPIFQAVNLDSIGGPYTEATARQTSWGAEWDGEWLINSRGGSLSALNKELKFDFEKAPTPWGDKLDVSGNTHAISVGNEPSWHIVYLASMLGIRDTTQKIVDELIKTHFGDSPSGLPGNDDLGAMSSFQAWSMLGLYPADVCSNSLVLGRPFVTEANLKLREGMLRIVVENQDERNLYISKVTWRGLDFPTSGKPLDMNDLQKGGELKFWMTSTETSIPSAS